MSSKTSNAPLPEGLELAGYRIVRKISSGGFSFVYLAYDEDNNLVAIKEYLPATLATRGKNEMVPSVKPEHIGTYRAGLRCFFEEGRVLARIFHPNIVRVVNFFRAHDTVYMVMNYEVGRALQELILKFREQGDQEVLSEIFIRETFISIMNGLREVHANKMLHLDLKPANIYLRRDGTPILLDFGAARTTLTTEVSKLFPMYTPGFAPLELYRKQAIGPWTDIYSLGACMFACMAGIPPQAADSRTQDDKMDAAYRALRGIYSDELISIVRWCMKMEATSRPQSIFQLQKVLTGQVAQAVKPPWQARIWSQLLHVFRGGKRSSALSAIRATHDAAIKLRAKQAEAAKQATRTATLSPETLYKK